MPKSLFNFNSLKSNNKESLISENEYKLASGLKTISINDSTVAINPSNGGWAVFEADESDLLEVKGVLPQNSISEFLFTKGLCSKNGKVIDFNVKENNPKFLYLFEFAVTTLCNLKCKYCFADASTSKSSNATEETARLFIDRVAEYIAETHSHLPIIIEFTGGEPLLNFPLIRYTIEYAKNTYEDLLNLEFCLQSNLTLLTSDMIDFFKKNKVGIGVSCDGFESLHNAQRPFANGKGSYKSVESSLIELKHRYPETIGGVITVVSDESVEYMPEIALYMHMIGLNNMVIRPLANIGRGENYIHNSSFAEKFNSGLFNILKSVITPIYEEKSLLIEERYLSLTFKHILQPYHPFMCERTPCGSGSNICVVTPNGNVYGCNQEIRDDTFLLGNINKNTFQEMSNSEIVKNLSKRTIKNIEECNNCAISSWCNSPCPYEAYKKYGSIMSKSSDCELMKDRYIRALTGLINNEYNLTVISKLSGLNTTLKWDSIRERNIYDCVIHS